MAKGFNFRKLGYSYSGFLQVLKTIVKFDYLWNRIRIAGGAYGAIADFSRNGNMYFASFRDPHLKKTLDAYDELEDYLSAFNASEREMTRYIIGTVSELDKPLTASMKGEKAAEYYIRGITLKRLQKERDQILNISKEDIRMLAGLIGNSMKQNYYCVIGSESKIKDNEALFDSVKNIFE